MRDEALNALRCPACRGTLVARTTDALACTNCGAAYPVVNGIPRFVPAENYAGNFGLQWNEFRLTQLDSHTGIPLSRQRFLDQTGWTDLSGKRVLDAGCGAGRFAEVALSLGAELFAIDYSSAVDACQANLGASPRLQVLQADIYALPFEEKSFDCIYSLGVLQHTPDVHRAFQSLVRLLKPGGTIVVDLYPRNLGMYVHPRKWLRPITVRISPQRLFRIVRKAAPPLLRVSTAVKRVPFVGRILSRFIPVANYTGVYALSPQLLEEWAILDTFDWLAPRYDQPQTGAALTEWMREADLQQIEVFRSHHLTGRGVRREAA